MGKNVLLIEPRNLSLLDWTGVSVSNDHHPPTDFKPWLFSVEERWKSMEDFLQNIFSFVEIFLESSFLDLFICVGSFSVDGITLCSAGPS